MRSSPAPRFPLGLTALLVASALGAAPAVAQPALSNLNCATYGTYGDPDGGGPGAGGGTAAPSGHVEWPASNPVWRFDYVRPGAHTTLRGAGLELRDVYYRDVTGWRLVLRRAHVPILNVEYNASAGGCGCFRDWSHDEVRFDAGPLQPGSNACTGVSTPGAVRTTCDANNEGATGGDVGSFTGVAFEDFGTELVMTSHMQAGWYRYRMKWHFYTDGRIWPEYSFSAATSQCTGQTHRHHAYWRFDFDLDGTPANDVVTERNAAGNVLTLTAEAARTWGPAASGTYWQVADATTGMGYDIVPSSVDRLLPVVRADGSTDTFAEADAYVQRYRASEHMDDGVTSQSACDIRLQENGYVNGESVSGQDVVLWYRSGALHTGGNPWECDIVGPTLRPQGLIPVANEGDPDASPAAGFLLEPAVPNPFNPTTSVRVRVAQAQEVTLSLYDVTGRRVATLFAGFLQANRPESVRIDGSNLPSGTYVVVLEGATVRGATRIMLVR